MQVAFTKQVGGCLTPFCEDDVEDLQKIKTGEVIQANIKRWRNPQFHKKVFAFFNFCFEHWRSDREFMDEQGQRDVFRKHLTVLAGYYNEYYKLDGSVRIEAKSLAYANMEPREFEQCYHALVNAAMKHIFKGCGKETEQKLMRFF